jgi:hypothetical protein
MNYKYVHPEHEVDVLPLYCLRLMWFDQFLVCLKMLHYFGSVTKKWDDLQIMNFEAICWKQPWRI